MEAIIKALKELSDLLRTRFKEMAIIALCVVVYKQQIHSWQQDVEMAKKNEQIISLFRETMMKQQDILYKTNQIMNKADTIISK